MQQTQKPVLIIGGIGKTGGRVNTRLQAMGIPTRPVSRSTQPGFDWKDRGTWRAALRGAASAYITYQMDLAFPEADEDIRVLAEMAKEEGLAHLVLLSGRGEEGAQKAEQTLISSGVSWNVVRAGWFNQNFSESFMLEGIQSGNLVLPVADIPEPFVDVEDIADVAVAALTNPEKRNQVFEVTGPRLMHFEEIVASLSKALGREITLTKVSVDDYIAAMAAQGVPEDFQWLIRMLFTETLDGRNAYVANGVAEATGKPARDFDEFIARVLPTGVWNQETTQ